MTGLLAWGLLVSVAGSCQVQYQQTSEPAQAQQGPEQTNDATFAGPDAVQNRLETDRVSSPALFDVDLLDPYYDWKDRLYEDTGFAFGLVHVSAFLQSTDALPGTKGSAAGGVMRQFGSWDLLGRGTETTGSLRYLVEYRHLYTDNDPAALSLDSLGSVGASEIPFTSGGWHLTNLYWDQEWKGGEIGVYAGFLDVTDFVDVFALTSPWTDFFNFAFSIGSATMDVPDDAALGAAGGTYITDGVYVMAGIMDINSDPEDPFQGFESVFEDHEYFTSAEIGWAPDKDQWYLHNYHATLWHADKRDDLGLDDGWGFALSFSEPLDERWLLFARGGYADADGSLLERSVSIGFGYQPGGSGIGVGDQLGVGFNWGKPNSKLFGPGLNDQYAAEAYYRLQVTRGIAITPSVQLLIDPALNSNDEAIGVFGVRARFAF